MLCPALLHFARPEITAGAPKYTRRSAAGVWATNDLMGAAELELACHTETSYKLMVRDQQAGALREKWARARHWSAHK